MFKNYIDYQQDDNLFVAGECFPGLIVISCAAYWLIRSDLTGKRGFTLISYLSGSSMIGNILLWLHERIKLWIKPATSLLIILSRNFAIPE